MAVLLSSVIESTVEEMTERGFPVGYVAATEKELERFRKWNLTKGREYFQKKTVRNTVRKNSEPVWMSPRVQN